MSPRPWSVLLWVLLLSTAATGRETRQGTVLVAGAPGEKCPCCTWPRGCPRWVVYRGPDAAILDTRMVDTYVQLPGRRFPK